MAARTAAAAIERPLRGIVPPASVRFSADASVPASAGSGSTCAGLYLACVSGLQRRDIQEAKRASMSILAEDVRVAKGGGNQRHQPASRTEARIPRRRATLAPIIAGIVLASAVTGSAGAAVPGQQESEEWTGGRRLRAVPRCRARGLARLAPRSCDAAGFRYERARQVRRQPGTARRHHFDILRRDGAYWVETDGPDNKLRQYPVAYVFGVHPLQQYLLELPGGRLQALDIAWDSLTAAAGGQRWFHLGAAAGSPSGQPMNPGAAAVGRPDTRATRTGPVRTTMERPLRRMPFHEPVEGLRSEIGHVRHHPGTRSMSPAKPAMALADAT